MARQVLLTGKYLGGHPGRERPAQALLRVSEEGIRVKPAIGRAFVEEPWSQITELAAEGPDQVASRFTATRFLLAGPFALAFKKKQKVGYIVVQGEFGEFLFEVEKKTPQELRAKIAPWRSNLRVAGSAAVAEMPPPAIVSDAIAQLGALADLRDRGVLTDEEFAAQKARVLGEPATVADGIVPEQEPEATSDLPGSVEREDTVIRAAATLDAICCNYEFNVSATTPATFEWLRGRAEKSGVEMSRVSTSAFTVAWRGSAVPEADLPAVIDIDVRTADRGGGSRVSARIVTREGAHFEVIRDFAGPLGDSLSDLRESPAS